MSRRSLNVVWLVLAGVVYAGFAVYLYRPYFGRLGFWEWLLLPAGACAGALGCYVLSRRWVVGFSGSLLAGLVYGFGPFVLSLSRFHETAVLLAASIPWLFLPAAYWGRKRGAAFVLSLLPFVVVALFFRISGSEEYRLFTAPIQAAPEPSDLLGFVTPLVMVTRTTTLPGLYHAPITALVLGLAMMFRARRYGVMAILVGGFALTFCRSFLGPAQLAWLGISPILWLSIPLVVLSVLAGVGLQGLIEASRSDGKWVLASAIVSGVLSIVALSLAAKYFQTLFGLGDGYARLFVEAAKMYVLATLASALIFAIAHLKLRLQPARWLILCSVLAVDVFLSAQFVVDKLL